MLIILAPSALGSGFAHGRGVPRRGAREPVRWGVARRGRAQVPPRYLIRLQHTFFVAQNIHMITRRLFFIFVLKKGSSQSGQRGTWRGRYSFGVYVTVILYDSQRGN